MEESADMGLIDAIKRDSLKAQIDDLVCDVESRDKHIDGLEKALEETEGMLVSIFQAYAKEQPLKARRMLKENPSLHELVNAHGL